MRDYEIVYIFRSNFTPEEIEAKIERYHAILTGDGKGEITAVEQWGKRQLAYPIEKQPNGYYVVAQFTADPAVLPELERVLTLEEDILRYLIVLSEGELPIQGSMQSEMDDRVGPGGPPRRDDDDEKRPGQETETAAPAAEAAAGDVAEAAEETGDEAEAAEEAGDEAEAAEEAGDEGADETGDAEKASAGDDPDADQGEADNDDEADAEDADDEAEEAAEKED